MLTHKHLLRSLSLRAWPTWLLELRVLELPNLLWCFWPQAAWMRFTDAMLMMLLAMPLDAITSMDILYLLELPWFRSFETSIDGESVSHRRMFHQSVYESRPSWILMRLHHALCHRTVFWPRLWTGQLSIDCRVYFLISHLSVSPDFCQVLPTPGSNVSKIIAFFVGVCAGWFDLHCFGLWCYRASAASTFRWCQSGMFGRHHPGTEWIGCFCQVCKEILEVLKKLVALERVS